jgi:hypothetical protein
MKDIENIILSKGSMVTLLEPHDGHGVIFIFIPLLVKYQYILKLSSLL